MFISNVDDDLLPATVLVQLRGGGARRRPSIAEAMGGMGGRRSNQVAPAP